MKLKIICVLYILMAVFGISPENHATRSGIIQKKKESRAEWSQSVITTIKEDPKIYQIMLLLNNGNNYENNDHSIIIRNLQENLPTLHFKDFYAKEEIKYLERKISLMNPRDTTLFMLVEFPEKNSTTWTEDMMAFVKELSTVRIRPKCLILRFFDSYQTSNYSIFLEKMWQDLFLDVTILDVIGRRATIYQLNPFVAYKTKLFSRKTQLFPKKLRNLNKFPIKVAILDRPPFVKLKRNSTNYPVEISGPDAEVGKIFAKVMNYRQLVQTVQRTFGNYYCDPDKLTGFHAEVQQNKMQMISVTGTTARSMCSVEMFENTFFALDHYVAIIPKLKKKNFSMTIGTTFYCSILLTVLITIVSWIVVKSLKFERTIWNWTVVIQILFGVSVVRQPRKLRERVIFGCFLVLHFYYSCNILVWMTDINFRVEEKRDIGTLNDLLASGLQFGSELSKMSMIPSILEEKHFTTWVKNGRVFTYEECIEFLLKHKNVTCIMRLSQAEWHAGFYREQNLVKFVPEFITSVATGFILEPGSPYVEKFHKVYIQLTEFALLKRWKMKKLPNTIRYYPEKNLQNWDDDGQYKLKIRSLLIGIMITGYFASIVSFLVELVLGRRN